MLIFEKNMVVEKMLEHDSSGLILKKSGGLPATKAALVKWLDCRAGIAGLASDFELVAVLGDGYCAYRAVAKLLDIQPNECTKAVEAEANNMGKGMEDWFARSYSMRDGSAAITQAGYFSQVWQEEMKEALESYFVDGGQDQWRTVSMCSMPGDIFCILPCAITHSPVFLLFCLFAAPRKRLGAAAPAPRGFVGR